MSSRTRLAARLLVAVLATVLAAASACSYGFGDLRSTGHDAGPGVDSPLPRTPREAIDPAGECNPVSDAGCPGGTYCLGEIASGVAITSLRCRGGFGSGSFGTYCADLSFCVAGFICWVDPATPTAGEGMCAEACFDSSDCSPGYHCDTASSYQIGFADTTLYRCVP